MGKIKNLLDLTPYRRAKWRIEKGVIVIRRPRYRSRMVRRIAKFLGLPLFYTIRLDSKSSRVWNLIDGRRTVRDIGERMSALYGEEIEPLYGRLAVLLSIMRNNELIGFRELQGCPSAPHEKTYGRQKGPQA